MSDTKKIVIADDHAMFRKALCMLIESFPQYTVLFDAENGVDFTEKLNADNLPDIVLLDIAMPKMDGYDTASWIRQHYPEIKVLALSTMDSELAIIKMIKSGARGYVLKDAEPAELKLAFSEVLAKGFYYNGLVTQKILQHINSAFDNSKQLHALLNLSEREVEFLNHVCSEKSYQQIAKEMFLAERTIDGYREALFKKLQVSSRVGLVLYAIKNNIVQL